MEQLYYKYLVSLYGDCHSDVSPIIFYQSWLLRGDEPELYKSAGSMAEYSRATPWGRTGLDTTSTILSDARNNSVARELNQQYHYDRDVKRKGREYAQLEFSDNLVNIIVSLQEKVLSEIERKGISIECNPSSNFKIGDMQLFSEHPITAFYGLPSSKSDTPHQISVSLNTDDKGVFATSLEREFAILAAALHQEYDNDKTKPSPREVLNWLNDIREMAFEMRFNHD